MTSEQPLAIAPALVKSELQHASQPCLNQTPVYSNVLSHPQAPLTKSQSYSNSLDKPIDSHIADLHLDPVVMTDNHVTNISEKKKGSELKLDNDLTMQDKENILLSPSRLRLLQDTTMIESALDLDSLEDSSIGNNSQAGLMTVHV